METPMIDRSFGLKAVFFIFISALGAQFLTFAFQARSMNFTSHSHRFQVLPFFVLTVVLFFLLAASWWWSAKRVSSLYNIDIRTAARRDLLSYTPLLFFSLFPLLPHFFLDSTDLLKRMVLLGTGVFAAVLYLKSTIFLQIKRRRMSRFQNLLQRFEGLPLRKKALLLLALAVSLYFAGGAILTLQDISFSGDEPHYLIMSHSLLKDGDLEIGNNYRNRDYLRYMPGETKLTGHTTDGKYSFHQPGLSIVAAPVYALALLFKGGGTVLVIRFFMGLISALLSLQIFLLIREIWDNDRLALQMWALYSFTSPVFFYGFHFYTEPCITLLSLYVFRRIRFGRFFSIPQLLGLGAVIGIFIWFNDVKYLIIAAPLVLYSIWILYQRHGLRSRILSFLLPPFILAVLYYGLQYTLHGTLSPAVIQTTGDIKSGGLFAFIRSTFTDIPLRFRLETLAGYFLDQRDGFLLYSPIYFFGICGAVEMFKRKREDLFALLFIISPYILISAFLTQRTGYAPQARPVLSVTWAFAIMMGYFLAHNGKKFFRLLFNLAAVFSFACVYLLLRFPHALYQLTTYGETERAGGLFLKLSSLHFYLPKFLPSFVKMDDAHWPANWYWIGGIVLFTAAYLLIKKHDFSLPVIAHPVIAASCLGLFFVWLVLFPRTVLLYPRNTAFPSGEKIVFYSLGRVARMPEPGRFVLPEADRDYVFYFTSWRRIRKFKLEWGAEKGTYEVELRYFDTVIFSGTLEDEWKETIWTPPDVYPLNKTNLYRITISLKNTSTVATSRNPFHLNLIPLREGTNNRASSDDVSFHE